MKHLKLPLGILAGLAALTGLCTVLAALLPMVESSLAANPHVSYLMFVVSGLMLLGTGVSTLRAWQFQPSQLLELGMPLAALALGFRSLGKFQNASAAIEWASKVLHIVPKAVFELLMPFAIPLAGLGALIGMCAFSIAVTMLVMRLRILNR